MSEDVKQAKKLIKDARLLIDGANFKLNGITQSYYDNLEVSLREGEIMGTGALRSVKVQIMYIAGNIRARGDTQKIAKKELHKLSK